MSFRWSYIIAPVIVFILSLILVAYFYRLLPAEVAVRFDIDGVPEMWLKRGAATAWMLLPQFLLVLLAAGVAWGATKLNMLSGSGESGGVRIEKIVSFMGNIVALPQVVLLFAMGDILSYNSYQIHIMPMWLFWLAVLALATIALAVVGILFVFRARRAMS